MLKDTILTWPRRRWLAVAVSTPLLMTGYIRATGVPLAGLSLQWLAVALGAASVGAGVLASYLPAVGHRLEVGCSPCAAMSGLTLLGGLLAISQYGAMPVGPALALAVAAFGLVQRLGQPVTCTNPVSKDRMPE